MKKIILILVLLPLLINAQVEECAFVPHPEMYNINNFSRTVKSNFDSDEPYVLNVKFILIQADTDYGIDNNTFGIDESHLLGIIAKINIEFNQFNIFFKYRDYTIINDSNYLQVYGNATNPPTPTPWDLRVYSIAQNKYDYNNLNVFITQTGNSTFFQTSDVFLNKGTVLNYDTDPNISHEFGHALSLLHIFDGTLGSFSADYIYTNLPNCGISTIDHLAVPRFNPTPVYPNTYPTSPENVTRDVADPNYNADTAGDFVIDTNAAFKAYKDNSCSYNNVYTYFEDSRIVDPVGVPYKDLADEINNHMDYHNRGNRSRHFSNGQGTRMREAIDLDVFNVLSQKLNLLPDGTADVSVLYEPYKIESITTLGDNIYSTTDLKDGTMEVCRVQSTILVHKFQPGFDYTFYNGNDYTNEEHTNSKFELPYVEDGSVYRAVKIDQINNDIILYQDIVCIRPGIICEIEPTTGGKVVTTTNLGGSNITIKTLNSQETADPNLEQDLESGKFHIIEKTTDTGAKTQKTIYIND